MIKRSTSSTVAVAGTVAALLMLLAAQFILTASDGALIGHEAWRADAAAVFATVSAAVGVLLVLRVPEKRIGWLLCAIGIAAAAIEPAGFYAVRGLVAVPGSLPLAWAAAWFSSELAYITVGLVVTWLILLFPGGRLQSRGEVVVARLISLYLVVSVLVTAVATLPRPGVHAALDPTQPGQLLAADQIAGDLRGYAFVGLLACALAAVTVVVRRHRRADGLERQQIKWFAYAGLVVFVIGFIPHLVSNVAGFTDVVVDATNAIFIGTLSLLPAAMAVAILRYRLYGIDVVISRALLYGSLAALITGVYVGIAVGIGALVGSGGRPNLGLSILATAIVAVGFQPARERLQRVANRLVYGKRATPYQVLSEFSSHVAGSYSAPEVLPRMARVLQEGTGAESAAVWLRSGTDLRPAAAWPDRALASLQGAVTVNGTLPHLAGATRAVEVRYQGELLGALTVDKRRGESLTPVEEKLLDDLAHQAGLVLKNVGLTADLQRRLEELRASRQRLVSAQDAERRRLERNLHDGAQQHLVALKVKLGLAEMLAAKDPEKAKQTLQQLKADADEALETLRDLARGIYPPLLAEKGLASALESQARKATLPVAIDADGVGRYPQEVEATVYFCVLEALQNVQKYAGASRVNVALRDRDGELQFTVEDDGRGFDVEQLKKGAGLTNMEDRLDSAGGEVTVISAVGRGTAVAGRIPVPVANAGATPSPTSGGDADRTETGAAARLESPPGTRRMPV